MEKNKLRLELIEKIIACEDAATLRKVEEILSQVSEIQEEEEHYITQADPVPASHYRELEEEFRKYTSGEGKGTPWEDFRNEIKSKYGF